MLINSTPFIISFLHFKELNNLLIFMHHNLDIFPFYICFFKLNPYATDDLYAFKELNNLSIFLNHNLENYSLLHLFL